MELCLSLLLIILIILIFKKNIYEYYPSIYGSEFNRAEDYKYYNVTEQTLSDCNIILPGKKIKNWENQENIYNIVIPDVVKRLNSKEFKSNPRFYYSQWYYDRKGSDLLEIPGDISLDVIGQYLECAYQKNLLNKY